MTPTVKYDFTIKALTELLASECGCEDGHWELGMNFNIVPISIRENGVASAPSLAVQVTNISINKVPAPTDRSIEIKDANWLTKEQEND